MTSPSPASRPASSLARAVLTCAVLGLPLLPTPDAGAASSSGAEHVVVLQGGRVVECLSRPVIALGRVSFLDARGRSTTLPVGAVDVKETQRRMAPRDTPLVWDRAAIRRARGNVQYVGKDRAEPPPPEEELTPAERQARQVALLEEQISGLEERQRELPPGSPERERLLDRQRVLQGELSRVRRGRRP